MLTLQKIWECSTGLMPPQTVIFRRMYSFSNHLSIQMIQHKYENSFNFTFELVSTDQVIKFIDKIYCDKGSSGDIPEKFIKIESE